MKGLQDTFGHFSSGLQCIHLGCGARHPALEARVAGGRVSLLVLELVGALTEASLPARTEVAAGKQARSTTQHILTVPELLNLLY